ncbi:unnamed protein product [Cladocopium goreaui]|uniref:Zeaxanthin 7,8(7',8')-cleavage dioxygenase, chromoplastic (CsZCD) (Zeaxanthin 7,8-dioxygenase) n=1 Tax=Cladocopium goreaui TaxID=2562237 RepID=A0A9P1CQJ9_9DINO|nr:unnamed protein product [Cladocopium goreaui]
MSDTLLKTANTLGHDLEAKHILQWHGDMHLGIEAARRHVAPNSMRLSDWAHVTGVTSQGPSGLSGLLLKEMPAEAKDTVLPWILQYCRISKQWPAFLFHVVWESLFLELEAVCGSNTIRKLQRQYFTWNADAELWDAPWRSAPDRIMPGTDAGSAPQESWHGTVLKPAFEGVRRKPAEVARILQEQIVQPQLRVLEAMQQDRAPFQDWPAIGQFLDQHILENDVQLKKEGRTSGKSLLAWGKHQRWEDPSGNLWMLVPTSKLKTDWRESTAKKKVYKDRALLPLQPRAVQHYAALITATSTHDVRQALASLDLYNCQTKTFKCWTKTAKALDDWRCVVSGPLVDSLWQEYQADSGPSTANQHRLPKGRPSRKAKAAASPTILPQIIPAIHNPARASVEPETTSSAASMSPEHLELRSLLRSTSLGHLYQPMCDQGVSIPALQRFQISDFVGFFRMSIGESHTLMQALEHRAAAGASSVSAFERCCSCEYLQQMLLLSGSHFPLSVQVRVSEPGSINPGLMFVAGYPEPRHHHPLLRYLQQMLLLSGSHFPLGVQVRVSEPGSINPGLMFADSKGTILGGLGTGHMRRVVIDVQGKSVKIQEVEGGQKFCTEFPRIRDDRVGCNGVRYGFSGLQTTEGDFDFRGLLKWDFQSCKLDKVIHYPEGVVGGEPVFIPKSNCQEDDDGYIGLLLWNEKTQESTFAAYDAKSFDATPVVEFLVHRRVPLGFHAAWITEQQFQQQLKRAW